LAKKSQPTPVLTPTLVKAARALLSMDQTQLAAAVGVSRKTISWIEITASEKIDPRRRATLESIRERLEKDWHIQFVFEEDGHGEGIYLRRPLLKKPAR
jgi:DNA-binding XRE family transcriptional regulator